MWKRQKEGQGDTLIFSAALTVQGHKLLWPLWQCKKRKVLVLRFSLLSGFDLFIILIVICILISASSSVISCDRPFGLHRNAAAHRP